MKAVSVTYYIYSIIYVLRILNILIFKYNILDKKLLYSLVSLIHRSMKHDLVIS